MSIDAKQNAALGATTMPTIDETKPRSVQRRSRFDTIHSVVAKRGEFVAKIVRVNPGAIEAMQSAVRWVQAYAAKHNISVADVVVSGKMTREGVVLLTIVEDD